MDVQAKDTLTRFCCLNPQNPEGFRLLCELLRSRPAGDERDAELLTAAMHLARIDPWSEEARESLRELGKLPEGCATGPLFVDASEPMGQQLVAGAERHGKRKKRRREQSDVEKEVHHQTQQPAAGEDAR